MSGVRPPTRLVHVVTVPQTFVFLEGQLEFMRRHGLEIVGISSPGPYPQVFSGGLGIQVHTVEMPRRITPWRDLLAVWHLVRLLRTLQPAIVHAHTPKGGLLGMIAAWICRVPVRIYHMRGLPLTTATGMRRRLLRWTEQVSCRLSHRVLCVSHSLRQVAIEENLCAASRITTLLGGSGNGVDAVGRFNPRLPENDVAGRRASLRSALGIDREDVVVAFVGRVVRDKGVGELAAAWLDLAVQHPHAHLIVAGPVEPQDPVPPEALRVLREHPRVHLLGDSEDVVSVYAAADVVTLPSYREGLPNVPLEAAAMELPVVTTQVPGCTDAVAGGETGTIVPPRDARALARALVAYIGDGALRQRHGSAGRERVLRLFRREAIWAAILDEYRVLLESHGDSAPRPAAPGPVNAREPAHRPR